ncbi:galaxin [Octopus bimaculoides]|uniref:Galaxin-like repeats domain-containing protein n=1 Tax=Octopus bimaculoides TaxID=37653 RepID=A0A0L8HZV2_OCTBM|nr:galaxin [Octopus bimaculoides]|eukprot:XP_014767985.1 PREDICTED: galaxin-like [Octopus bimaculoides]
MSNIVIIIASALLAVIGSTTALHWSYYHQPHHPTYYCNGQPYYGENNICCGTQVGSTLGLKYPACCGDAVFDRDAKVCCSGALIAKSQTVNGCCNAVGIDISTQECCINGPLPRVNNVCCGGAAMARVSIYDVCCGTARMNKATQLCCNGAIKTISDTFPTGSNLIPNTYACCGTSIFDTRTNNCFNKQVYSRPNLLPWWQTSHHHHH